MKGIILIVLAAIGLVTSIVLVIHAAVWFVELGNAFIEKNRKNPKL